MIQRAVSVQVGKEELIIRAAGKVFLAFGPRPIILLSSPKAKRPFRAAASLQAMNLVGVHTQLFRGTAADVALAVRRHGLNCAQLTPSFPDWRFQEPGQVTAERCRQVAEPFRQSAIVIVAVAGGDNLLDPDLDRRHPAIMRLHALIRHARAFGTEHVVVNLASSRCSDPSPAVNRSDQWWPELRSIIVEALRVARDHDVTLLLKPDGKDLDICREEVGRLIADVARPGLGFVMDPAHYLLGRPPASLADELPRLCEQIGAQAPLLHAKDLTFGADSVTTPPAGRGHLDYVTFLRLYRRYQHNAPVILEHVRPEDIAAAKAYLDSCYLANPRQSK